MFNIRGICSNNSKLMVGHSKEKLLIECNIDNSTVRFINVHMHYGGICINMISVKRCPNSCSQYKRRCKIRAPYCAEIFHCRHCHNDSKNSLEVDPLKRHNIPRHDIKRVIAHCVILNRMFNKPAFSMGFTWEITFAQNATSLMMMFRRINTTVINVESAG